MQDGKYYTGQDIKDEILVMKKGNNYKIHCNKDFSFIYKSTPNRNNLSAGELGIFCSHATIWNNMVNKNFSHTLQFEDSIDRYSESKDYYTKGTIIHKVRYYIWSLTRKHDNKINTAKIKQSIDSIINDNLDVCDVIHLSYFTFRQNFIKIFLQDHLKHIEH